MHVKKGDKVKVITGKDKGKSGTVARAYPSENKVIIEGVAVYKRHRRGAIGQTGRIVEMNRPIDASNVALLESAKK